MGKPAVRRLGRQVVGSNCNALRQERHQTQSLPQRPRVRAVRPSQPLLEKRRCRSHRRSCAAIRVRFGSYSEHESQGARRDQRRASTLRPEIGGWSCPAGPSNSPTSFDVRRSQPKFDTRIGAKQTAHPRRLSPLSAPWHTDRGKGVPGGVTDGRRTKRRRCGASVPPCGYGICRTYRRPHVRPH